MPLVNVTVNSRSYTIACDDGDEEYLQELAAIVDAKAEKVSKSVGQVGDTRLLLMVALLMADEHKAAMDVKNLSTKTEPDALDSGVAALDRAAARIEEIAARLAAA